MSFFWFYHEMERCRFEAIFHSITSSVWFREASTLAFLRNDEWKEKRQWTVDRLYAQQVKKEMFIAERYELLLLKG